MTENPRRVYPVTQVCGNKGFGGLSGTTFATGSDNLTVPPIGNKLSSAAAVAAARTFAQQPTGQGVTAMPFYEKGDVRIYYEETGSGFPLLLIPGSTLDSRMPSP